MIFKRPTDRFHWKSTLKKEKWHKWFAWYPVWIFRDDAKYLTWFKFIMRKGKLHHYSWHEGTSWGFEYQYRVIGI